jgi:hypothetical protein
VPGETFEDHPVLCPAGTRLPHDHDVDSPKLASVMPERLAHQAFQAIPARCLQTMFFGDREPEPAIVSSIRAGQDREEIVSAPVGFGKHASKRTFVR